MAEEACRDGGVVWSLGPLIHNASEVDRLQKQGVRTVRHLGEVPGGAVLFRAHGVCPETFREAETAGLQVIDATCPYVARAQRAAQRLKADGRDIVIVGEREHPEVRALVAWAGGDARVVESPEEAAGLPEAERVGVIAQTTLCPGDLEETVRVIAGKVRNLVVTGTLCSATYMRQEATRRMARGVDIVLVVGGRDSANTRRLVTAVEVEGTEVHHIQTADEIEEGWFRGKTSAGVAAGASTPEWIIKEVISRMEELKPMESEEGTEERAEPTPGEPGQEGAKPASPCETQGVSQEEAPLPPEAPPAGGDTPVEPPEAQEEVYEETLKALSPGDRVKGKVVRVSPEGVLVDVGYKTEGFIAIQDLAVRYVQSPQELLSEGQEIDVVVKSVDDQDGTLHLSKRLADEEIAWEHLQKAMEERGNVEGEVIQEVKGGLMMDVGLKAFVPASQVERGYVSDLSVYVGRTLTLKVLELDRNKERAILSRRQVLEEEAEALRHLTWSTIHEGEVRHGVVKGITDFGAFVDVGGVDGLLHVSELSWGRVDHPSQVLKEGEEIDVKVLRVDHEKGKISLGLKQILPDPWNKVGERYQAGAVVTGKVTRLAPFGAFVQLEPGVEGLVHISELADRRVEKPEEVLSAGEEVKVKILRVRQQDRRISLSVKEAEQESERDVMKRYMGDKNPGAVTLGDVFGNLLEERKAEAEAREKAEAKVEEETPEEPFSEPDGGLSEDGHEAKKEGE
jgi:4-hydroxy-3-methylbut-2-enyl diphosphate reductase